MLKTTQYVKAFCSYPFQRLKFTPEGDVTMCCFQQRKCLGNILTTGLREIWNSPLAEAVRAATARGVLHPTCKGESCPYFRRPSLDVADVESRPLPVEFEIDLPTQHCNIGGETPTEKNPACMMCERHLRRHEGFRQEDRLEEICKTLNPFVRHLKWLHIQGVAEPFWKDRIFELLDWLGVERYMARVWISTTTNGTLMTPARRAKFLHYPKSTITWSLDAGSPEVYKVIRRVDMYDRIVENLKAYSRERQPGQYVHIHNNINTINVYDVEKMVELAADAGVDRLDFNATYGVPAICVSRENVGLFRDAQKRIMHRAKSLGVYTTFMRDFTLDIEAAPTWGEVVEEFGEPELVQLGIPTRVYNPDQSP
jgi:MoaA/NifB/PqqE/SkfB family radical SAM enzyme